MKRTFVKEMLLVITLSSLIWLGACGGDEVTEPESMFSVTLEPIGDNCRSGGVKIATGLDENGDGILSDDEIMEVEFICENQTSFIQTHQEPPGPNCTTGGVRIETGVDHNGDGVLSTDEISATHYFCNAVNSLVNTSNEPAGANCPSGGVRIETGTDDNGNEILDTEEIVEIQYVCNGSGSSEGGDLLVRLEIGRIGATNHSIHTNGTTFIEYSDDRDRLTDFSKLDYPGVDSIVYAVPMRTSNATIRCFVELYDGTNNTSIIRLQSYHAHSDGIYETVYSGNIYDLLPDDGSRIDLANRIASEQFGNFVFAGLPAQLLLFRRN